ncbi:MAG: GNAT family N-acetyltransferase [Myxococcales bacterium]|nr:GNAT family N-acetyltransferase [Myxococcales bacterium]
MTQAIHIRDAVEADCAPLTALCLRSKAHWGYDDAFMARCRPVLTVTPATLRSMTVRVAETNGGTLLGVAAWGACEERPASAEAELELMFVEPGAMGRGVGRRLARDLRAQLQRRGVEVLWILSDPGAEPFYRRLGALRVGRRSSDAIPGRQLPWLRLFVGGPPESLETERLRLRLWELGDRDPFAALNADARVAQYLPSTLDRSESDALAERIDVGFSQYGFGLWAVERTDLPGRPFVGALGLSVPSFDAHFTPCVEIGWRLAAEHWGLGLATEGARAVAAHAFGPLGLDRLVSFTVPTNLASRRVMEKIGMRHDRDGDFEHPSLPAGHALRRHVLYRLP